MLIIYALTYTLMPSLRSETDIIVIYFHRMTAYKVPVIVKKIKTFLKKLFVFF